MPCLSRCRHLNCPERYDAKVYAQVKYFYAGMGAKKCGARQQERFSCARQGDANDTETRGWTISSVKNDWYLSAFKQRDMAVHKPSERMQASFQQLGDVMLADWLKKAGLVGHAVIETYRK